MTAGPPHLLLRAAVIINFWTNHANVNKPAAKTPEARTARRFPGSIELRRYAVHQELGKHLEGARLTKYTAMGIPTEPTPAAVERSSAVQIFLATMTLLFIAFFSVRGTLVSGTYTAGVKSPGCSWDGALPYLCLRLGSIRLCSIGPKSSIPIWVPSRQFSPFSRGNGKSIVLSFRLRALRTACSSDQKPHTLDSGLSRVRSM